MGFVFAVLAHEARLKAGQIKVIYFLTGHSVSVQNAVHRVKDTHGGVLDMAFDKVGNGIFGLVQIELRVCPRRLPAKHGTAFHGLLLCRRDTQLLILEICDFLIAHLIIGAAVRVIVPMLVTSDGDKLTGIRQNEKVEFR